MGMQPLGDVIVNGRATPGDEVGLRIDDIGLLRGYGCFEVLRSYNGVPFRIGDHLDRLEKSAAALRLPLPGRDDLERWATDRAAVGDAVVRIVVTGGTDLDDLGKDAATLVFAHEATERPDSLRLLEVVAPWHPAGHPTELAGVKALSYAPNTAAVLRARAEGFDDALLLDPDTMVLELPMSSIGWVVDGTVETPSLDLGILRSVTRHAMIDVAIGLNIGVTEGMFASARLHAADEAFVMSTTKEIVPVVAVGGRDFEPGPITQALAEGFRTLVERETGTGRSLG